MWNGSNNNFHRHPHSQESQQHSAAAQQQQQQQQQAQEQLRRRLSLELAAAAYSGGNVNVNVNNHQNAAAAGLLGAAGFRGAVTPEDHLALAVAAQRQQVEAALQEERNNVHGVSNVNLALAQAQAAAVQQQHQQQLELMALQHQQRQQHQQHQQHQQQAKQQHQHQQQQAAALQELQRRSELGPSPTHGSASPTGASAVTAAVAAAVASEFEESQPPSPKQKSAAESTDTVVQKKGGKKSKAKSNNDSRTASSTSKRNPKKPTKPKKQKQKQKPAASATAAAATEDPTRQKEAATGETDAPRDASPPAPPPPIQPRGKPEAMAKKLASALRQQEIREELEAEKRQELLRQEQKEREAPAARMDSLGIHSSDVTVKAAAAATTSSSSKKTSSQQKSGGGGSSSKKRRKPESNSTPAGKSATTSQPPSKKKKPAAKKKAPPKKGSASGGGDGGSRKTGENGKKGGNGGGTGSSGSSSASSSGTGSNYYANSKVPPPTMDDAVEPITEIQYRKLEALMKQFCHVPLLAEFSRPVALLHPELMNAYTKIVEHPIDLGKVCRRIRRRQYETLRDVRLDAWRIFANCFKYHSHPSNRDAVPSFVSIALHLRELFNDLWQEHLLRSDFPPPAPAGSSRSKPRDPHAALRTAMEQRVECRKKRLVVAGLSVMAGKCLERAAEALEDILENGGLVDALDTEPIWGEDIAMDEEDEGDLEVILENFRNLKRNLREIIANNEELGVDELETSVRKCYTEGDGLENLSASLRIRIASRMNRYLGQLVVPIHEATCRGVSQSSIWGCMAAAVWARESSKKPFWPALVLGIIAPEDQKEDWHQFLTERNEARLPEKLKSQLLAGKRKAEQAVKKQRLGQADPQSFFLVEFLGSHEFIWVREADIVENFNAADDPNKKDTGASRSKKVSRKSLTNILASKTYANAIQEAQWALEEFELQLQDIGAAVEDDDGDEHEEEGYSYSVLCQSDDEADGETDDDDPTSENLDQDECNELLATNGLLDYSVAGRKRRAQILKLQKLNAEKKQKTVKARKARADKAKKAKDEKQKEKEKRQEKRDLDKRRRKRMREREKALKGVQHQKKKRKLSDPAPGRRHQIFSKRERAEAIVAGYVLRASQREQYKSLGLNGEQRWIQSALIDSTNLSGMALAFRAAAGMIPMPKQDTGAPGKIVLRPWDKIRPRSKKTSAERTVLLHRQIDLLERETRLRRASRARRLARLKEVEEEVTKVNASVLEDDKLARENPLKKSKKPHPLAGKKRKRPGDSAKANSNSGGVKSKPKEAASASTDKGASGEDAVLETKPAAAGDGEPSAAAARIKAEEETADDASPVA